MYPLLFRFRRGLDPARDGRRRTAEVMPRERMAPRPTRGLAAVLTLVLALAFALVGCGENASGDASGDAGGDGTTAGEDGRVVENAYGKARVPEDPRRVVTLDPVALLNVLALGEKPVGYATAGASGLRLVEDELRGVETVGSEAEPSVEKVAALRPDLIIGYTGNPEEFSEIAPTVDVPDYDETEWKRLFRFYGGVLGERDLAAERISSFESRVEAFREGMGARMDDTTVSFVRFGGDAVSVYPNSFSGSVLADVGLKRPENQVYGAGKCCAVLSAEEIPAVDADHIFVGVDPGGEETLAEYEKNPLWARLEGEKIPVDPAVWIQPSYPTADALLDDLEKYLLEERS